MSHKIIAWLVLIFAFSGCGKIPASESAVPIKVAFWGSPEEIDIITHSIHGWQQTHPNIKIIFEHTPYSGYDSKILTRIAGGAAPDIIATEVDYFVTFAAKGVLEDLNPFIEADSEFSKSDFFSAILGRFTVNGRLLAVPRDVAPFACVFYNQGLFDEAGLPYPTDDWTWEDLLRLARVLTRTDQNGRTTVYGFDGWAWQNFVYGNGGALVDDVRSPTKTRLDDPLSIEGLRFYADLANLYKVMPTPQALANLGIGGEILFTQGRVAMFMSGIWESPRLRKHNFNWDVVMFPKNSSGLRAFGSGGSGYAILKSSKHKKEAWEAIKALTGPEGQEQLAKRGLAQPSRVEVAEGEAWARDPAKPANKKMLNQAVEHIIFSPFHPRWREIQDKYISPQLDLVFNGKKTAADFAKEIAPRINAILNSRER